MTPRTRQARLAALIGLGLLLNGMCGAAEPPNLDASMRRCAALSDAAERLACFDVLVANLPRVEADRFGLTEDIRRQRDPVAVQKAKEEFLSARISNLGRAARGEWIFTLDNGQVWAQVEPRVSIDFKTGEPVRVERGAMSSLWLAAENHRKVKVRRLQ